MTDGPEAALAQAREVAGEQDVHVAGGARAVQQFLRAGLLDDLRLHVVPVLLGAGERLLDDLGDPPRCSSEGQRCPPRSRATVSRCR